MAAATALVSKAMACTIDRMFRGAFEYAYSRMVMDAKICKRQSVNVRYMYRRKTHFGETNERVRTDLRPNVDGGRDGLITAVSRNTENC